MGTPCPVQPTWPRIGDASVSLQPATSSTWRGGGRAPSWSSFPKGRGPVIAQDRRLCLCIHPWLGHSQDVPLILAAPEGAKARVRVNASPGTGWGAGRCWGHVWQMGGRVPPGACRGAGCWEGTKPKRGTPFRPPICGGFLFKSLKVALAWNVRTLWSYVCENMHYYRINVIYGCVYLCRRNYLVCHVVSTIL